MASKRSIITSNLPSIKEVLNEKNSLLVEPTIQGLVSGINKISQNKEWADKISAQALVDVQNYSWLKRAQKIIYEITNKQSDLNKKSLFVRIIKKINKPRRYKNLNQTIDQLKPKNIMEIGVWNGNRSLQMITAAQKYHSPEKINYYGFDLFEDLTLEKFKEEVSKMPPLKQEVEDKLRMTKSNINLFKGDTIQSLPENIAKLPKMDFIFIDGGHSLKTITNDWYCVQQLMHNETVVIFDDYWNRNDAGAKPIIEGIDKDRFGVEILKPQDKFKKEWGILKINFVKVKRKTL
jgi:predicted O-methyltransferase YrrM